MKYTRWEVRRVLERNYRRAIERLFLKLLREIKQIDDPLLIPGAIRRYARSPTFRREARKIVLRMATQLFSDGNITWREASRRGSRGRMLYNALQKELVNTAMGNTYKRIVEENAEWISTMPDKLAKKVTERAAKQYESGKRPDEIAKDIRRACPEMTKAHAKLIARTETSKASTALTQARCGALNLDWYVWRTSSDERVRDSHSIMDGVLINWNDPPNPEKLNRERHTYENYHAGNIFNCRCYPQPLIMLSDVKWPHKVYYGGRIRMMTLAEFKRIAGGNLRR